MKFLHNRPLAVVSVAVSTPSPAYAKPCRELSAWPIAESTAPWPEPRSLFTKVGGEHGEEHAAPPITPEGGSGFRVGFWISRGRHNESLLPGAGDGERLHLCKAGCPKQREGSRGIEGSRVLGYCRRSIIQHEILNLAGIQLPRYLESRVWEASFKATLELKEACRFGFSK